MYISEIDAMARLACFNLISWQYFGGGSTLDSQSIPYFNFPYHAPAADCPLFGHITISASKGWGAFFSPSFSYSAHCHSFIALHLSG